MERVLFILINSYKKCYMYLWKLMLYKITFLGTYNSWKDFSNFKLHQNVQCCFEMLNYKKITSCDCCLSRGDIFILMCESWYWMCNLKAATTAFNINLLLHFTMKMIIKILAYTRTTFYTSTMLQSFSLHFTLICRARIWRHND